MHFSQDLDYAGIIPYVVYYVCLHAIDLVYKKWVQITTWL